MSPGLAMKQCVNGRCWMNGWLGDGEPGSSFKSRALRSRSRLLVLEWLYESVVVVLYVNACKLDLPSGADNKPNKSSEWDPRCTVHWTAEQQTLVTLQPVFSRPLFPALSPPSFFFFFNLLYLVLLFLVASQVRKLQESFPVHLHQMNVWCYEKLSISSKLICVDFCMEKKS